MCIGKNKRGLYNNIRYCKRLLLILWMPSRNYRNRRIFECYSWTERGNTYMLDDEALHVFAATASGFTSVYLGLRALGNGTENARPAYYEGFYYSKTEGDAL
ncbi:hypothetical protein PAECIP112173_01336 [Paenibacillus sp. JJ-100]|nr:hypothetical protein PAECIP112173_01336 [Paenibacillus sp. JJ-100]